jgi:ribosomal protein S18 acetylase RimI-like enzyme
MGGSSSAETVVRRGTAADAPGAARLHIEGITTGFLPTLGPAFLSRLYRFIAHNKGSFLLVVDGDGPGGVSAFLAGTEDTSRLYRRFCTTQGPVAALAAGKALVRGARQAMETLAYPRAHGGTAVPLPAAELLAMAVDPASRGRGVGRALVGAFFQEMTDRGAPAAKVVADSHNDAANGLYLACGFRPATTIEVHGGQRSNVLTWP